MNLSSVIILGILQGFTEFLPISSSGHLVLAQALIPNFNQPGIFFDVVLHAGTLFAVIVFFRKNLIKLVGKYAMPIAIGTIPAVLVGLTFQNFIENFFKNVHIVALALLVTSLMNFLTNRAKTKKSKISIKEAIFVGLAQAFAIIPGISRSGATIFSATAMKIKRTTAAEFSFLLSVPAVFGASSLEFIKYGFSDSVPAAFYIAGFLAAFFSGVVAINLVFSFLQSKKFNLFAIYCLLLGVFSLIV